MGYHLKVVSIQKYKTRITREGRTRFALGSILGLLYYNVERSYLVVIVLYTVLLNLLEFYSGIPHSLPPATATEQPAAEAAKQTDTTGE